MPSETKLNITLPSRVMSIVRKRVESGRYKSASDVVREGIRLLDERDRSEQDFWAGVRDKVAIGRAELREGKGIPSEVFLENMKRFTRQFKARPGKARNRGKK